MVVIRLGVHKIKGNNSRPVFLTEPKEVTLTNHKAKKWMIKPIRIHIGSNFASDWLKYTSFAKPTYSEECKRNGYKIVQTRVQSSVKVSPTTKKTDSTSFRRRRKCIGPTDMLGAITFNVFIDRRKYVTLYQCAKMIISDLKAVNIRLFKTFYLKLIISRLMIMTLLGF